MLWVEFIPCLTEDYSLRHSLSDNSEKLPWKGKEKVRIHVILMRGTSNQAHSSVEGCCWSQRTDTLVNCFSAFLSIGRCKNTDSQNISPENIYLKCCSASLPKHRVPHSWSLLSSSQGVLKVKVSCGWWLNPCRARWQSSFFS